MILVRVFLCLGGSGGKSDRDVVSGGDVESS